MKNWKKVLSAFAVLTVMGTGMAAVGCGGNNADVGGGHSHEYRWVDNGDGTHKQHCAVDGCDEPDKSAGNHEWNADGKCEQCDTQRPSSQEHNHDYKWVDNGDGTHKQHCAVDGCDEPDKSAGNHNFGADGKCEQCEAESSHQHAYGNYTYDFNKHYGECSADGCYSNKLEEEHKLGADGKCEVCGAKYSSFEFIPSNLEGKIYTDGGQYGVFKILAGTEVRTRSRLDYTVYDVKNGYYGNSDAAPVATGFNASKSVKMGATGNGISVNAIAAGRLTVYVDNGSGGKTENDFQKITVTRPGSAQKEEISFSCVGMYAIVIECDKPGTYKIERVSGTVDLYYAKFETMAAVAPVEKIEVTDGGKVSYVKGQEFDSSRLQVQIVYENQISEPLDLSSEEVTLDSSSFKKDVPGEYEIKVTYTVNGKSYEATYVVKVNGVYGLELGFNAIYKGANTAAGNGQYINRTVKQFYFNDEEFSSAGLTVKTVLDAEGTQKTIVSDGFTVTGFEKGKAGVQTITVAWTDSPEIKQTFNVYVAAYTAASVTAQSELKINVAASYSDAQAGVLVNGVYNFKTIQQALDFLNGLTLDKNVKKIINLAEGLYRERLEINIPNLIIRGADTAHPEKTIIEWDSLVGIKDEGGFEHVTDSTATLNVREKATGFVIEGVTISNWYNSEEHFTEKFGAGYGEHRALAALVQADKVVIDNCRLLGYQDTIEFFTGRQVVTNTYICGRTDFIFGTNNTTYFKNCEIESIVEGGYVTAFKGNNKGADDYIQYGAVFDGCKFIAPKAVIDAANTSLGRTWGAYAAVAYVNCNFAGHISKVGYGAKDESGASVKFTRYTAMSGVTPADATVKFFEYNNSGDGAISEKVNGMTLITDPAEGAKYSDLNIIFHEQNGKLLYADAWGGSKGVEISAVDYRFDAVAFPNGNVSGNATDPMDIFGGVMTVHGVWHTELTTDKEAKDFGWFNAGTKIVFNVSGKVTIKTYGSSYGKSENVKINYVNGKAIVTIIATEDSPIALGCCITLIQVDGKAAIPAHFHEYGDWVATTLPTADAVGVATQTCENCEANPANSITIELPVLSKDNYAINAGSEAGKSKYTYTNGKIVVEFEADALAGAHAHDYDAEWTITATADAAGRLYKTCKGEGECDAPLDYEIPALSDARYTITQNTATLEAGGNGTYSININGVDLSFTAATPKIELVEINSNLSITFGSNGNYKSQIANNIMYAEKYADKIRDNGGNNSQISNGTIITLKVVAGAKITVSSYPNYTNYTVKINGADYNGGAAETGTSWEYTAQANETVQFISGNNNYFYSIGVSCGLSEINAESAKKTFASSEGVQSTEYIEFSGVSSHNNGEYWNLGKTGTIKIKVAAGATITLNCGYWGVGITINGEVQDTSQATITYTATEGGEIVIGCIPDAANVSYLQGITVSFPA